MDRYGQVITIAAALVDHNQTIFRRTDFGNYRTGRSHWCRFGCVDAGTQMETRRVSTPEGMNVSLEQVVDHIDHICQITGNCNHVGIGTDLDGAFGKEQSPKDLRYHCRFAKTTWTT